VGAVTANAPRSSAGWEGVVSVHEVPDLERELVHRLGAESGRRAVGVTDLISLRRAYYRTTTPPVPIAPERQARLDQGRAVHRSLGSRLASEGILEARVRREGLVGRIDLLADVPVEVKTTTGFFEPSTLPTYRPDHVEQLAMYCALLDRPSGRLLSLLASPSGISDVQAVDVAFRSAARIRDEMQARAEWLRTAWAESSAERLPRCPWFGRGCEFEAASVCGCTGSEPPLAHPLTDEIERISPREDVRERLRVMLAEPEPAAGAFAIDRFREILYPRRAYFERTSAVPLPPEPTKAPGPEPDLWARLSEAVESGPAGEVARVPARAPEPEEEVVGFRGSPLLVRTSKAWDRFRANELIRRAPQYALDLGLRCATTGTKSGFVVVGFERAENDRDRVQVLELRYRSLTPFSRMYRERSAALEAALRENDPRSLPACPAWMFEDCRYRAECGCLGPGASETR